MIARSTRCCAHSGIGEAVVEGDTRLLVAGADGQVAEEETQALLAEAGISIREIAQKVVSIKVKAHKPA